jgi:hypothetical protein
MLRRILGVVMLLIGVSGVILSVVGVIIGRRIIDTVGGGLDDTLQLTTQSLDTVEDTLLLAKSTMGEVNAGLGTVHTTAVDLGQTINATRPLLDQIAEVASEDVPTSIEAVQTSLPAMIQVAAAIDDTLTTLNSFGVNQTILGVPIQFDLGVNYDPEVPFDESVSVIGASLDGLPARLRSLRIYINVADNNLETISGDIFTISEDLSHINSRLTETGPLLDDYIRIVTEANDNARRARTTIQQQLSTAKLMVTVVMIWVGLIQIAPLYLGWELLSGRRQAEIKEVKVESEEA